MPPQSLPAKPNKKFYFYYGHRKPSQNRPIVRGGLFTNRRSLNAEQPESQPQSSHYRPGNFTLQDWDPDSTRGPKPAPPRNSSEEFFRMAQKLSPIARYICDSFRKNKNWGPAVIGDLNKLRRVTPTLVTEVLKVQNDPVVSSKFFHWAGKQKGYKHTFAAYNALAYCLNRSNRFRAADQVPELMQMQGKPPTEKQFEILIRMHADDNRGLRVYYVYEKMKKFGVKPRVFLYNRIMDALVKTGHLDLAMAVYRDFKEDGLGEDNVTFMILIKGLCKAGRVDEMFDLLGRMRTTLCTPDVFAYTAMIRVLVAEGNLDGCLKIWEEMRRDQVQADVVAYTTLIKALCIGNRVSKAYEFFREMKERGYLIDRAIYSSLTDGFVASGMVSSACDLLKDLVGSGCRADLSIYNPLIKGLCNSKRIDKAYKVFQVAVQEGLQPDIETVKPMLVYYADSIKIDDFCSLLVQMQKLGSSITDDLPKLFSYMIESERLGAAMKLFSDPKVKGYSGVPVYNILMAALFENGEAKEAFSLLSELTDSNLEPDSSTLSLAIMCLVELENVKEACTYHNKIKEMSCTPSVAAYQSLIRGLFRIGEIDPVILLIRDCLANTANGPLEFKYALTIIQACKSNDSEKILIVIDEMVEQYCALDEVVYTAIIFGMAKYGTIEEARKVFMEMKNRNLLAESKMIIYDEMLVEQTKKRTADLVVAGLRFFRLENKLKSKGCTLQSGG
ncbi:hypothetical protein Drorol1_Dr00000775 [Drosera rotundifolia]